MTPQKQISDKQGVGWLRQVFRDNPWLWVIMWGCFSTGIVTRGQQAVGWLAQPAIQEAVSKADSSGKAALSVTKAEILDSIGKMLQRPNIAYEPMPEHFHHTQDHFSHQQIVQNNRH